MPVSSLLARALGRDPPGAQPHRKRINLALQGGGAHGAFTWGVLDHLLADGRLEIDGISGTSAGAVNAVMLADGLGKGGVEGGADEARKRLAEFWRAASLGGDLPAVQRAVTDRLFSLVPVSNNPAQAWISAWTAFFSPYDFNPLNINPLKDLIERFVDFEALRAGARDIFIAATNVQTGRLHVFSRGTLTAEAVMASACLPTLFRAVEIGGVPYWDGGYTGNPVVSPFFRATGTEDLLIVQINPLKRRRVPHSNSEIMSRVQEISFNSALLAELRGVAFINRLIDEGRLPHDTNGDGFRRIKVHRIVLSGLGDRLSSSSKLRTDFESFELLRKLGQRAARRFLDANFDAIGVRSSIDLAAEVETERG
jgi:NTE family protein